MNDSFGADLLALSVSALIFSLSILFLAYICIFIQVYIIIINRLFFKNLEIVRLLQKIKIHAVLSKLLSSQNPENKMFLSFHKNIKQHNCFNIDNREDNNKCSSEPNQHIIIMF